MFPFHWTRWIVRAQVRACVRYWEGWLCKPGLASVKPQSLPEMKDDVSARPSRRGGHSAVIVLKTNHTLCCWTKTEMYDITLFIGIFSGYRICAILPHNTHRERKTRSEALIWRKSGIQAVLKEVTHSKQIAELKIKQLTNPDCVCFVPLTQTGFSIKLQQTSN